VALGQEGEVRGEIFEKDLRKKKNGHLCGKSIAISGYSLETKNVIREPQEGHSWEWSEGNPHARDVNGGEVHERINLSDAK